MDRIEFEYVIKHGPRAGEKVYVHAAATIHPPEDEHPHAHTDDLHCDVYTYDEPILPIDPEALKDDWKSIEQKALDVLFEDFYAAESDYYAEEGA